MDFKQKVRIIAGKYKDAYGDLEGQIVDRHQGQVCVWFDSEAMFRGKPQSWMIWVDPKELDRVA